MASNIKDDSIEKIADYYDWSGMDHSTSPFLVRENKFITSLNFNSDNVVGGKNTRPPYGTFLNNPDSNQIRNLIFWVKQNGDGTTTSYLIRISGGNIYKWVVGVGTTWSAVTIPVALTNTTQPFAYAILNNLLHLSNGYDAYMTFDGTTLVRDTGAPKFRNMTVYQRRIYGTNVPGNDNVYFSSVNYQGAPLEYATLFAGYAAGVTSIQINASPAGLNPFAGTNPLFYQAILGAGTANQENVVVTAVTGTAAPYTLTLQAPTVNSHLSGDVMSNNAPWYSDSNNASTANYFPIDPGFNGQAIYLNVVNSNLVIHKSNGALYTYNGSTISNALQSTNPFFNSPGEATVSPYAPDQIGGIEFFFSRNGVFAYQGGYPSNISYEIYDYLQNMPGSQYTIAPGIAFNNRYYLAIGNTKDQYGNALSNAILAYDFVMNHWDVYSFLDFPICWAQYVDAAGNQQLIWGTASGQAMQLNTVGGVGDNGVATNAVLQTQWMMFGAPERIKSISSYSVFTNPGASFQFQFATDFRNNWQPVTTVTGFGGSNVAPIGMKNFKAISFRVTGTTAAPMTFYGITLKVNVGKRRNSGRRI